MKVWGGAVLDLVVLLAHHNFTTVPPNAKGGVSHVHVGLFVTVVGVVF